VERVGHPSRPVIELAVRSGFVAQAERDLVRADLGLSDHSCFHP
jgi:hypothetical protein